MRNIGDTIKAVKNIVPPVISTALLYLSPSYSLLQASTLIKLEVFSLFILLYRTPKLPPIYLISKTFLLFFLLFRKIVVSLPRKTTSEGTFKSPLFIENEF
jgi:hypothetical protein